MCNPAAKVAVFDNHLLFYKSVRFKVIPGTMFSLSPFTEQERKGRSHCQVPGTVPNPAVAHGRQDIASVDAMGTTAVGMRREVPVYRSAQRAICWVGEAHEP